MLDSTHMRRPGPPAAVCLALAFSAMPAAAATWAPVGPPGGDVRSLAVDPRDPDVVYLGTADGILFRAVGRPAQSPLEPRHKAERHGQRPLGKIEGQVGQEAETRQALVARDLDPLTPFVSVGAAWPLVFAHPSRRQAGQAVEILLRILKTDPGFSNAHLTLGAALRMLLVHVNAEVNISEQTSYALGLSLGI